MDLTGLGPLRPARADSAVAWPDVATSLRVTVSGSFTRYGDLLRETIHGMRERGLIVMSPRSGEVEHVERGFAFLHGDPSRNKRMTEDRHLDAIRASDMMWIINRDGHVGISTAFEMGFATALGVPIYAAAILNDDPISTYAQTQQRWRHAAVIEARRPRRQASSGLLLDPRASAAILLHEAQALVDLLDGAGPVLTNEQALAVQAIGRRCGRLLGSLANH